MLMTPFGPGRRSPRYPLPRWSMARRARREPEELRCKRPSPCSDPPSAQRHFGNLPDLCRPHRASKEPGGQRAAAGSPGLRASAVLIAATHRTTVPTPWATGEKGSGEEFPLAPAWTRSTWKGSVRRCWPTWKRLAGVPDRSPSLLPVRGSRRG